MTFAPSARQLYYSRLTRGLALAGALFAAGCTDLVRDPVDGSVMAKSYTGWFGGFYLVAVPPGHAVVPSAGILPTAGTGTALATVATTTVETLAR